jgi:hypothetical protein
MCGPTWGGTHPTVDANEGETINEDQANDEAQKYETDEDSDYLPSYFSGDDDTLMEVDLDPEPSRRRNNRLTEGQGTSINVEENVDENDFPNDNDNYHSEKLRSPISTDDEGDGNGRQVFPQFNSNAEFGQVHLELGIEFETLDIFKETMRNYTVYHGRDIKWLKNDKQ